MKTLNLVLRLILCLTAFVVQTADASSTSRWQTQAGTPVVFYEAHDIPMLYISLAFRAGSSYDGQLYGLSTLTTHLLNQGNDGMDANEVANQLAATGAQYASDNSRDMLVMHLKTLTEPQAYASATALFERMVASPDFPEKAFQREKTQQAMQIRHALESPNEVANQAFFRALYQAHPYAHPVDGDIATLEKIALHDVKHFHKQYLNRENAILVLVGDLSQAQAHALSEKLSNALPKGKKAPQIPKAVALHEAVDIEVPFPSTQTAVRLGELGIDHHNPQYFPLMVGNYTLGGGSLVSRLAEELREKRGLTYGVYSQFLPMPERGPFLISLSTQTSQAKAAEDLTREVLSDFIKKGPTEDELTAAKQYLVGSFPLSTASNRDIASILMKMAFYGLPDNYLETYTSNIESVTQKDIKQAFQKHVHPQKLLQVSVGKA